MQASIIPPVFILNLSYTGLGIARSFVGSGIKIYGVGSKRWVFGNFSRHIDFYLSPDSLTEPEELCQFLVALAENQIQKPVIFPTRDHDIIFLDNFREKLEPFFIIALPIQDTLNTILNKWKLCEVANECNVLSPKTYLINNEDELKALSHKIEYPVLIKPLRAADWRKNRIWDAVGKRKTIFCQSEQILWKEYNTFQHIHSIVLLQKYIEGEDDDIYTFCSYCDRHSNILVSFNTRKIIQMPEKFGTGIVVQSFMNNDIAESSKRLLKHIKFTCISEVEYKRDSKTGNYYLIEVNPRFWDQHQLSRSSGINLPLIAYYDLINKNLPIISSKFHQITWIAEDNLTKYFVNILLTKREKVLKLLNLLKGKRSYAIWSIKDPLPFIVSTILTTIDMIKQSIPKIFNRLRI